MRVLYDLTPFYMQHFNPQEQLTTVNSNKGELKLMKGNVP